MSASMHDIDRSTHLKILIVGAAAATIVVAVAANVRSGIPPGPTATTAPAVFVTPPPRRQIEPPRKVHPIALAQSHPRRRALETPCRYG
jgi:hypothetical protein